MYICALSERIATSLKWLQDIWSLLLRSVLVGKAQKVSAASSLDQSSDDEKVKAG